MFKKITFFTAAVFVAAALSLPVFAAEDGSIPHLSAESFNEVLDEAPTPVLVQFDASWCPFCRKIQPALNALANEKQGKLQVFRIDVDAERELANSFEVKTLPTLILFSDGDIVDRFTGAPEPDELNGWVETGMKKAE